MATAEGVRREGIAAAAAALTPVELRTEAAAVRRFARDGFWFSPVLAAELQACRADLVAFPKTPDELDLCLSVAHDHDLPVTVRGGGTGNYGQAVPLEGSLVIVTTGVSRILEVGTGFVRAEAGATLLALNNALAPTGQELAVFPSTQETATLGGFIGGGSGGIGSLAEGMLRDNGNLIALVAHTVEHRPRRVVLAGAETLAIHHAWGLNGVIGEATVRAVPKAERVGCIASFDSYAAAYAAGHALADSPAVGAGLASVVDARIAAFFPRLEGRVGAGRHLLVALVPAGQIAALDRLVAVAGGTLDLALTDDDRRAARLPRVFEFSYNHTTLQVLKADRGVTCQQNGVPDPADVARVAALRDRLGADVWSHHEFARIGGRVAAFDLPVIRFTSVARLREIASIYRDAGWTVWDAHTHHVEGGGLKTVDYRHLARKKRMDPKGLLNPGKSQAWDRVRHLAPEAIEALAP